MTSPVPPSLPPSLPASPRSCTTSLGAASASPSDAFAELLEALATAGTMVDALAGVGDPAPVVQAPADDPQAPAGPAAGAEPSALPAPAPLVAWPPVLPLAHLSGIAAAKAETTATTAMSAAPSTSLGGGERPQAAGAAPADRADPSAAPVLVDGVRSLPPPAAVKLPPVDVAAASEPLDAAAAPGAAAAVPLPAGAPTWMQAATANALAGTPAPAPLHQADIASHPLDRAFAGDVAAEVRLMAEGGLQQAELRLNPAELGPVRIHLALRSDGADISFAAAHASTREGLTQGLPALREMLASQGLQLGHAGIGTHLGGQGSGQAPPSWPSAFTGTRADAAAGSVDGTGAMQPSSARPRHRGLLDLYA